MRHIDIILGRVYLAAGNLRERSSRQDGQALIEYALIISLIAVVAIGALQLTGTSIKGILNKIAGDV